MNCSKSHIHLVVWAGVALLILLLAIAILLFDRKEPWSWLESYGYASKIGHAGKGMDGRPPGTHYSERVYWDDLFRTKINTWSNLAYVVVGFYAFALGWRDTHAKKSATTGYLARTPWMSFLFGFGCVSLGFGSGLYHASLTRVGQQLDVAAMWMPLMGLIAINIGRWFPNIRVARVGTLEMSWITTIIFVILTFYFYYYKWSLSSFSLLIVFAGIVASFGVADLFWRARKMQIRWVMLAGFFLALGVSFRQLDAAGRFSGPDDWWQGHALWHVFTALCLLSMYVYLRVEEVVYKTPGRCLLGGGP